MEALIDPLHALHFLLPTGDSRSGRRSFDSKHVPSPARRGSRSGGEGKADANLTNFFSTCCAWPAQALPPGVRWPKNRVVGFLGEESENFFERCPSDCLTSARLTLPATRWVASECLSTCGCRFSGDSPRAVAITWKMRKNCVRSSAPPFWDGRPDDSKPPGAMPVSR